MSIKRLTENVRVGTMTDANWCRLKSVHPGDIFTVTHLLGGVVEVFCRRYRLTAIGESGILVRRIRSDGRECPETSMFFTCRKHILRKQQSKETPPCDT